MDIQNNLLVPKQEKLDDSAKKALLESMNISSKNLPKIFKEDVSIADLKPKSGDIIKITRESPTAGVSMYYRVVIDG
jgi:DNA-directed RNA polymerase subunit H